MDELSKLFAQMEAQETRLLGIAHCIVPKEEDEEENVPIVEEVPVFLPPSAEPPTPTLPQLPQLLLMSSELKENLSRDSQLNTVPDLSLATEISTKTPLNEIDANSLITVDAVPSVVLTSIADAVTAPTITETLNKDAEVVITTQMPVSNPDENSVEIVMSTQKTENMFNVLSTVPALVPATSPMPIIQNESANNPQYYIKNLENVTETSPTSTKSRRVNHDLPTTSSSSTLPPSSIAEIILGELESVSKNPEPENYIYETFEVKPVEVSPQRNEHTVFAEEPPEIPNGAVPAA